MTREEIAAIEALAMAATPADDVIEMAENAASPGEWGSAGAKGGTRAALGKALLAANKSREDVPRLCAALRAALDRAECAEAEVRLFVDASGCANGEVLSERLATIGRILGKTPVEDIADAAERLRARAEKAEAIAKIERALRTARHCGLREYEILKLRADLRALGVEP